MPDKYPSFEALAEGECADAFRIRVYDRGSAVAIVAPHGGDIEPGTSEIALAIAGTDLSCYLFEGRKPTDNGDLHITSSRFDEPRCLSLLREAQTVVAIHGERSHPPAVYLGGLDRRNRAALHTTLTAQGFTVRTHWSRKLQGLHERNICNIGRRQAGIQLELSRGLRETFFLKPLPGGRSQPADQLSYFAQAIRLALGHLP